MPSRKLRFQARLTRVGQLRCVDVPGRVTEALGREGYAAVRGRIQGCSFQSTLTPRGDGLHRLFVHSDIWRPLGLESGDLLEVELESDPDPVPELPEELRSMLDRSPESAASFDELSEAKRREIVRWVVSAMGHETRTRRIEELQKRLLTDLRPRKPPLLR